MPKTKTNSATSSSKKKKYDPFKSKPYNRYNIFYILERELFLQSNSEYHRIDAPAIPSNFITGYECIVVPDLPPRYASLDLHFDWYMPGKRKFAKRDHKKSHGLASFQDLARLVANGYKNIDDETLEYVTTVATMLKQQYNVLRATKKNQMHHSAAANVSDTRGDDSAQHYVTQPSPANFSAPAKLRLPNMSDFLVDSAADVDATTTNVSSLSNTTAVKCYPNNSCSDANAPQAQVVPASASISEVDIDDRLIMAMWYFTY